jgi:predicted RNA-binding Zn-ribbon protein involved in translation (DUF1610 family)
VLLVFSDHDEVASCGRDAAELQRRSGASNFWCPRAGGISVVRPGDQSTLECAWVANNE